MGDNITEVLLSSSLKHKTEEYSLGVDLELMKPTSNDGNDSFALMAYGKINLTDHLQFFPIISFGSENSNTETSSESSKYFLSRLSFPLIFSKNILLKPGITLSYVFGRGSEEDDGEVYEYRYSSFAVGPLLGFNYRDLVFYTKLLYRSIAGNEDKRHFLESRTGLEYESEINDSLTITVNAESTIRYPIGSEGREKYQVNSGAGIVYVPIEGFAIKSGFGMIHDVKKEETNYSVTIGVSFRPTKNFEASIKLFYGDGGAIQNQNY